MYIYILFGIHFYTIYKINMNIKHKILLLLSCVTCVTQVFASDTQNIYDNSMKQSIHSDSISYKMPHDKIFITLDPSDCDGSSKSCNGRHRNEIRTSCSKKFSAFVCLPNFVDTMPSTKFFHIIQYKSPSFGHPLFSLGYYKNDLVLYTFSTHHILIGTANEYAQQCIQVYLQVRDDGSIDYNIDGKNGNVVLPQYHYAYFKFGLYTNYKIKSILQNSFKVDCT